MTDNTSTQSNGREALGWTSVEAVVDGCRFQRQRETPGRMAMYALQPVNKRDVQTVSRVVHLLLRLQLGAVPIGKVLPVVRLMFGYEADRQKAIVQMVGHENAARPVDEFDVDDGPGVTSLRSAATPQTLGEYLEQCSVEDMPRCLIHRPSGIKLNV